MSNAHQYDEPTNGTPLAERTPEQQEAAVDRVAAAEAMLAQMEAEKPDGMWSPEARQEHLRLARLVEHPDDALSGARKAVLWLELVHTHLAEHQPDGWCEDAREGLAELLGMIGRRLEVADRHFDGHGGD